MNKWEAHLDEIKSLRDEINWRVKIAYTSSAGFISVFGVISGIIISQDLEKIARNNSDGLIIIGLLFSGLISMFMGVLNSNALIEKRIELYTLQLQKVMLSEAKEPIYSWLSYMYGYKTKKKSTLFTFIEKTFNAGIALFQYALPIILAISILIVLYYNTSAFDRFPVFYIFITILVAIAFFSSLYLAYFLSIVNKEHTKFYIDSVEPFINKYNENIIHENKKA
jgi:hypothetical protein